LCRRFKTIPKEKGLIQKVTSGSGVTLMANKGSFFTRLKTIGEERQEKKKEEPYIAIFKFHRNFQLP
jgi:hypothetical protein